MKTRSTILTLLLIFSLAQAKTNIPQPTLDRQYLMADQEEEVITIADLLASKSSYGGKKVKVKGKVVKYNAAIMGKNWLHIQDGSEEDGKSDLTITTDMTTEVGKVITVEGVITLDKDIGPGYFYAIIMEEAKILE